MGFERDRQDYQEVVRVRGSTRLQAHKLVIPVMRSCGTFVFSAVSSCMRLAHGVREEGLTASQWGIKIKQGARVR